MQTDEIKTPYNTTCKKLPVQWLKEAFNFLSISVLADSLMLRNPLLLDAPKHFHQYKNDKCSLRKRN
jgi:hypothetical protein